MVAGNTLKRKSIKIVVVGDGGSGKTCLLSSYVNRKVPTDYLPTVFEAYSISTKLNDDMYELSLNDTAGQDVYDRLRPLQYPDTDVMLVCFSADSPDSLYNAYDKWVPEVRHFCPNAPIVMVCTKIDLRDDEETISRLGKTKQKPVSYEEGKLLSDEVKASAYIECSSLNQTSMDAVFEVAIRATILKQKHHRKLLKMRQLRCRVL